MNNHDCEFKENHLLFDLDRKFRNNGKNIFNKNNK
jgi:hypothetical protein